MKILVAYASKYGSTQGIAEHIGKTLRESGAEADVAEVRQVKGLAGYDAFVVGSAAYMGRWLKEAREFMLRNKEVLAARPVWLFSSGPVGTETKDAKGRDVLEASRPVEFEEAKSLQPRGLQVFYGSLFGSKLTGFMGWGYRMAQKMPAAKAAMPEGDFRDWKKIEEWAREIAGELEKAK